MECQQGFERCSPEDQNGTLWPLKIYGRPSWEGFSWELWMPGGWSGMYLYIYIYTCIHLVRFRNCPWRNWYCNTYVMFVYINLWKVNFNPSLFCWYFPFLPFCCMTWSYTCAIWQVPDQFQHPFHCQVRSPGGFSSGIGIWPKHVTELFLFHDSLGKNRRKHNGRFMGFVGGVLGGSPQLVSG